MAVLEDLQARIYADRDFSPGGREVALALAWVMYHPEAGDDAGTPWQQASRLLGMDSVYSGCWRITEATVEDLPWYDPGLVHWNQCNGTCEGPRVRPYRPRTPPGTRHTCLIGHHPHVGDCQFTIVHTVPGYVPVAGDRDQSACGAHATINVTEYDPVTGWETPHWFCTRHRDRAREVEKQLRAALPEPPSPIPNRGGVLPRYFAADWAQIYAHIAEKTYGRGRLYGWKPPYHGVCRDDWPVPGKTTIPKRPRLALVAPN